MVIVNQFSIENIIRTDEDEENPSEWERREKQIRLAIQYHQYVQQYLQQQAWTLPGRVMEVRPMVQYETSSNLPSSIEEKRQKVRRIERKPRQAYSAKQLERLEAEFQVSF